MTDSHDSDREGPLAVLFANSAGYYALEERAETLSDFDALVGWAREAGIITAHERRGLLQRARQGEFDPEALLERALAFRDAVQSLLLRFARKRPSSPGDLATLNAILVGAHVNRSLAASANGYSWSWRKEAPEDRLLWPIAISCADLLISDDAERLKECSGRDCSRLFLDRSKNGSRRWCSMDGCGNRAKARRHYRRSREKRG